MSDRSSIIVRYNVTNEKGQQQKGFISNHYRGGNSSGMIFRIVAGLAHFVNNAHLLKFINEETSDDRIYQEFRRMFDVSYGKNLMRVSRDAVSEAKQKFAEGNIKKEDLSDRVFWNDCNFGAALIDILGNTDEGLNVKYALIDNVYSYDKVFTAEDYIKQHMPLIDKEDKLYEQLLEAITMLNELSDHMTLTEVKDLLECPVYEYIFFNEIERKKDEKIWEEEQNELRKNLELEFEDKSDRVLLEDLCMSVRSYNCLKRKGIRCIGDLRRMSDEELKLIKGLGDKGYIEIVTLLKK